MVITVTLIICFTFYLSLITWLAVRGSCFEKEMQTDTENLIRQHQHEAEENAKQRRHEIEKNPYGMN